MLPNRLPEDDMEYVSIDNVEEDLALHYPQEFIHCLEP